MDRKRLFYRARLAPLSCGNSNRKVGKKQFISALFCITKFTLYTRSAKQSFLFPNKQFEQHYIFQIKKTSLQISLFRQFHLFLVALHLPESRCIAIYLIPFPERIEMIVDQNLLLGALSIVFGAFLAYYLFAKPNTAAAAQKPAKPEPRAFSRAEVAQHNKEGDFWLILRTRGSEQLRVYDLTTYADEHPGGDSIYRNAGGDGTEGFLGPQHPPTVHDLVPEYYIGWIEDE